MALVLRDPSLGAGLIFAGQEELSGVKYSINPAVVVIVAPLGATMMFTAANRINGQTTVALGIAAGMTYSSVADSYNVAVEVFATSSPDIALARVLRALAGEVVVSAHADVARSVLTYALSAQTNVWRPIGRRTTWSMR